MMKMTNQRNCPWTAIRCGAMTLTALWSSSLRRSECHGWWRKTQPSGEAACAGSSRSRCVCTTCSSSRSPSVCAEGAEPGAGLERPWSTFLERGASFPLRTASWNSPLRATHSTGSPGARMHPSLWMSATMYDAPPPACRYSLYRSKCRSSCARPGNLPNAATEIRFLRNSGTTGATHWTAPPCLATRVTIATGTTTITALRILGAVAIGVSRRVLARAGTGRTRNHTSIISGPPSRLSRTRFPINSAAETKNHRATSLRRAWDGNTAPPTWRAKKRPSDACADFVVLLSFTHDVFVLIG